MKYKVGDRVRIKSLDWYYDNRDRIDEVACGNTNFVPDMVKYCEGIVTISSVLPTFEVYHIKEDGGMFNWTDEMIEGLAEEETKPEPKFKVGEIVYSTTWQRDVIILDILPDGFYKVGDIHLGWFKTDESGLRKEKITLPTDSQLKKPFKQEISLPEGYQFVDENDNVINARKVVLEKKKKEYPKTHEECINELDINEVVAACGWKKEIKALQTLLVCRDAYWKIAGEEMGLGKPWKPDWKNLEQEKRCIWVDVGSIILRDGYRCQHILVFPTEEMRDAFYENFKGLIEQCKELL